MINEIEIRPIIVDYYKYSKYFKICLLEFIVNDYYFVLLKIRIQKRSKDLRIFNIDIFFANEFVLFKTLFK